MIIQLETAIKFSNKFISLEHTFQMNVIKLHPGVPNKIPQLLKNSPVFSPKDIMINNPWVNVAAPDDRSLVVTHVAFLLTTPFSTYAIWKFRDIR